MRKRQEHALERMTENARELGLDLSTRAHTALLAARAGMPATAQRLQEAAELI